MWGNLADIAEVNQTEICFIPKINKPEFVSQLRPISLCNIIYKVVLNRLKGLVDSIISPFQTGFIHGRNIQENIVVA